MDFTCSELDEVNQNYIYWERIIALEMVNQPSTDTSTPGECEKEPFRPEQQH